MPRRRHALSDSQWDRIRDLFERPRRRGGPWKDHRLMLDGVLWVMKTSVPWRDLPERFSLCQTVYDRFSRWRGDGTLDRVCARLQRDLDRHRFDRLVGLLRRRHARQGDSGRALYRERNVVERLIGHLKEHRRIGTRSEKLAISYLMGVKLAFIERCFRILDPSDTA